MKKIKFNGKNLYLHFQEYTNGNVCIDVEDKKGELYLIATTNLGDEIPKDKVLIKNYSENEGIRECLIAHSIISKEYEMIDGMFSLHNLLVVNPDTTN